MPGARFPPDGQAILIASEDGAARLWETATGRLRLTVSVPCGTVPAAIFSPDGRRIAVGSSDGAVRIFTDQGEPVADTPRAHEGAVTTLSFSPDGQLLLSDATDHRPRIYDLGHQRAAVLLQTTGRSLVPGAAPALAGFAELSLVSDASAPDAINQLSGPQRAAGGGFPLPTPDRPHRYLAAGRNDKGELVRSRPRLVEASPPPCPDGQCPLPPAAASPIALVGKQRIGSLSLDSDAGTVTKAMTPFLDAVVRLLKWRLDIKQLGIQGHTEKAGSASRALDRTTRIAGSIRSYLIGHGIEPTRLASAGFGFACPRDASSPPDPVAGNRRVDFYVLEEENQTLPVPPCAASPPKAPVHVEIKGPQLNLSERVGFALKKGKSDLDPLSFPILDEVVSVLNAHPDLKRLRIEGHTDNSGAAKTKRDLSTRRAQLVRAYLMKKGIAASRLVAAGLGDSCPLVSNRTLASRAQNNRVEFIIVEQTGVKLDPPKCQLPPTGCLCKGADCPCTPGVDCPCTPGVNCRCTPGVDCPCTKGQDCACEEGKTCACTPGVNCPCTEGVDCLCTPGKNCPMKIVQLGRNMSITSFEYDSPQMTPEGEETLRKEIDILVEHLKQGGKIRVEGHGDNVGPLNPAANMEYVTRLSKGRAQLVHELMMTELRAKGVSEKVLATQILPFAWYSYKCAAVPYSTRRGKTKEDKRLRDEENAPNRRVEINLAPDEGVKCFVPLPAQE